MTAEDALEGRPPTLLATRPFRPTIRYDSAGALLALDSGVLRVFGPKATELTAPETIQLSLPQGLSGPTSLNGAQARLTAAGDRIAFLMSPLGGNLLVFNRMGEAVEGFRGPKGCWSGLLAQAFQLVEGGRSLLLAADAAASRTGSAAWVEWPDARLLEAYVALLDVDTSSVRGLVAGSKGMVHSMVAIEGECVAVSTYGRSKKIDITPWAALAGR